MDLHIKTILNLISSALAVVSLLPVLPFVDPAILAIAVVGILVGLWSDSTQRYLLNNVTATLVTIAAMAFIALTISRTTIAETVTHALILLLTIRLVTPKEPRHYLQIFSLVLFILAGSSLTSLDLGLGFGFLSHLVLMIIGVTLGLLLLTVFVSDNRLVLNRSDFYRFFKISLAMVCGSLILMITFFFILPRARQPIWSFINQEGPAESGLSESIEPGTYAKTSGYRTLAFRAEMENIPVRELYWRALVLNTPKGNSWERVAPPNESSGIINSTRAVAITMYPESRSDRFLVTLDRAALLSGARFRRTDDHVFIVRSGHSQPYRLEQLSHLSADIRVNGHVDKAFYLTLPDKVSPRLLEVAAQINSNTTSRQQRLDALAAFFREQRLSYSNVNFPRGPDALDEFLFVQKKGYCEFFASAYVTLARLIGIPTRLVGGYYGGEYNPVGGYYLVRDDSAHIWAEVLTQDNRWVRIDPSQWAVNASSMLNDRSTMRLGVVQQLIDSLDHWWVQTIVLFDYYKQINFLQTAGIKLFNFQLDRKYLKVLLIMSGVLSTLLVLAKIIRLQRLSNEARVLRDFRSKVSKRFGKEAYSPALGLGEFSERVNDDSCRAFAQIYQQAVFKDRGLSKQELSELKTLLKKIG